MADPVQVLLVEDDPPTRRRLSVALAADSGFAVREAGTLAQARTILADRPPPDVLITDLNLPDGHGSSLIRDAHARFPDMEILVISALSDERTVVAAIAAGASGYVLKDALPEDIAGTVRQVRQGHSPISAAIARYILRRLPSQAGEAEAGEEGVAATRLTKRETDILWGIAKGFTYNEIADTLGISRSTVPSYIKSIYRKLDVNSRGEAVFEAINRRLINL